MPEIARGTQSGTAKRGPDSAQMSALAFVLNDEAEIIRVKLLRALQLIETHDLVQRVQALQAQRI